MRTKEIILFFSLKQRNPSIFQDPCLYSTVCDVLTNSTCRVTARRFIQELFLDVSFVQVRIKLLCSTVADCV